MINIFDFLSWWYGKSPQKIFNFSLSTVNYNYHLFSIPYLFSTLLAPWKRDVSNPINPSIQEILSNFLFNLIARIMGFFVRLLTILSGFIIIFCTIILLIIFFLLWMLLPIITIVMLIYSILNITQAL